MALFASPQETQRALAILLDLQSKDPDRLSGILNKYANPFTSWPLLAEPTRAFLSFFETPGWGVETGGTQQNINPKIQELVEEFDREFAAVKEQQITAETASKKFVNALKEQAKKSGVTLPETQAPVPLETAGAPVSPERMQEIISATIRQPLPEKGPFFDVLTSFASERPTQSITDLIPRAAAVTEASRIFVSPEEIIPKDALFSPRAAGVFQQLSTIVNHPELIPKTSLADMTARWGENFVNSPWFTKLRTDANQMIADQKAAATIVGKFSSLFSDVSTAVFRGPIDPGVITFMDIGYIAPQIQITSPSHFAGIALDYGGQLVRIGGNYVFRKGAGVLIKKAAVSSATKFGLEAVAGAATGGWGWVAMAATSVLGWLGDLGKALLRGIFFMGTSPNPEDNWVFIILGIAGFFMFILPLFGQSMIDTAMVTSMGAGEGGAFGGENGYITAVGPIGTTTRSCANTEGILLNQCDSQWGSTPYKGVSGCTICRGGCGPTSTTMILHAFGSSSSVSNVAGRVAAHDIEQYKDYSCSSYIQSNLAVMQEEDLRTIGVGLNWRQASKYLSECGLIFALGNTPTSGHFVVITGINWDTSGKNVVSYNTLDPYYSYTTQNSSTFSVTAMYAVVHK